MGILKREDIKKFVLVNLGWPIVAVELDDLQIGLAITTALDEYLANGAVEKAYWKTTAEGGRNDIELPPEIATVSNVVYAKPFEIMAGMAGSTDLFAFAMGGGGGFGGLQGAGYGNFVHGAANLAVFYEYIQNRNRTLALDTTFKVMDGKLYIWPFPKPSDIIIIEYSKNAFGLVNADESISLSNSWGAYWIKRMSLAQCKNILGLIRGKFSTMAGATGESQTLNSAELLSQAKDEIEKLKMELAEHLTHCQFFIA